MESSHTNQIFHFTIHNICHIVSADFIAALISFGIFGIFGAGGNKGSSIFTLGTKDGISGKSGGDGIVGIFGIDKDKSNFSSFIINSHIKSIHISADCSISNHASMLGGLGMFGRLGSGTLVGTKLNLGSLTSVAMFIFDKSIYMLGIFIGGISKKGRFKLSQKGDSLQAN